MRFSIFFFIRFNGKIKKLYVHNWSVLNKQYYFSNRTLKFLENSSVIKSCKFESRLKRCNSSEFILKRLNENLNVNFDFMILSQLLLNIFTPLVSAVGIITNQMVIVVVLNKENQKTLKEKQYKYMAINSVSNIIILLIQILSLMNECQHPFGIFCSSIRKNSAIQYFKIVFVEGFASFFRLLANFSYIAFAISRLSLVGENGSCMKSLIDLSIKVFIIISVIFCGLLSVVKFVRFQVNISSPDETYPFVFYRNIVEFSDYFYSWKNVVFVLDFVYDLINYVILTFANVLIDLILLFKVKKVLKERENKMEAMSLNEKSKENRKKENEKIIKNTTWMIISNAFVNFAFKLPLSIISINDLRLIVTSHFKIDRHYKNAFNFPYSMRRLCHLDEICLIFWNFCTFLYIISLSVNLLLYVKYDRNFRQVFKITFERKKKKEVANKFAKLIKKPTGN